MNERLLELALEAGLRKPIASDQEFLVDFDWRDFAHRVVQECAHWVRESYDHQDAESIAWCMEVEFGLHGDYA